MSGKGEKNGTDETRKSEVFGASNPERHTITLA
jgi:hypothetical protein